MVIHDCSCGWRFVVGKKQVYGPIYPIGLPGHFTGAHGCHSRGRMMTRTQFEEDYSDCADRAGIAEDVAADTPVLLPCYDPHFNRKDQGLPNPKYLPHIHAPKIDHGGRPVAIIWEEK